MNIKTPTLSFSEIYYRVSDITSTEKTYIVNGLDGHTSRYDSYSEYGLSTLGRTVGFPSQFISELSLTNEPLANQIIADRIGNYFDSKKPAFFAREFQGKIRGIVSDKYAFFDDNEVCDIIDGSPIAEFGYMPTYITPERLHLRAIEDEPFFVDGDESPLYMLYLIDNSMVGQSAFKIRIGIYRQVCSNGLIVPTKEFILCKAVHRGKKDIAASFNEAVEFLAEKRDSIKGLIMKTTQEQAAIEELKEEFRKAYIQKTLNVSQKEADKVITLYKNTYGGKTKWAMVNAITEFARDLKSIDRRTLIESKALKAA